MAKNILECHNIVKEYDKHRVVDGANIHVKEGEIYGIVGPNGAGKSTIMKMILNLVPHDSGEIIFDGKIINAKDYEYLSKIGSLIENPYFYENLSGMDNLIIHMEYLGLNDVKIVEDAMKIVSLPLDYSKKVSAYSVGMKKRLAVARAIISRPKLLIMDEPTSGLDPQGMLDMRRILRGLNQDFGMTVIISSHILSEIEQIADTVCFIKEGEILEEIAMQDIIEKNAAYIELSVDSVEKATGLLENTLKIEDFKVMSEDIIRIYDFNVEIKEINKVFSKNDIGVNKICRKENNLEDYFFLIEEGVNCV
ncbi:MAG: ATP-binding cassette domain-containing protein [Pseudobutyrivibrio sp.]|nr:ATP-binding cassette domain-containing protein [Pseudobutyrivibrio sp.]